MNFAKIGLKMNELIWVLIRLPNVYLVFKPKTSTECLKFKEKSKLFDIVDAV